MVVFPCVYLHTGLQTLVADVFVCLASYSIRASELWNFLFLFNSPDPPVVRQLLTKSGS